MIDTSVWVVTKLCDTFHDERRAVKRKILGIVEGPTVEVPAEHLALSAKGLLDDLTAL